MWWRRWWWLLRTRCFTLCAEREFFSSLDMLQDISEQCLHTNINILLITLQNKQVIFIRFHFSSPRHPSASMNINLAACSSVGAMISLYWIWFHFGRKKTLLNFDNSKCDWPRWELIHENSMIFFISVAVVRAISIGNWIFLLWYAHSKVRSQIGIEKRAIISLFNRKIACESEVGCCIIIARCATSDAGVARLSRRKMIDWKTNSPRLRRCTLISLCSFACSRSLAARACIDCE